MEDVCHTIRHTIRRNGTYYYNRKGKNSGRVLRLKLSDDPTLATTLAEHLTNSLDELWKWDPKAEVSLRSLVEKLESEPVTLRDWAEEYLALKSMDPAATQTAIDQVCSLLGDRDIQSYTRRDVRAYVTSMQLRGRRTGTIRRRLVSVSAVVNYAYSELELDKRNPFMAVLIPRQGEDRAVREPFTVAELAAGYREAATEVQKLMIVLGETGCRLGEVVGLRVEDVDLEKAVIRIVPHEARRLKTPGSMRELPVVGEAFPVLVEQVHKAEGGFLYPRYIKVTGCKSTHASNALNKWLKQRFGGKTAHCLRHAFRDRLRARECPLELIDALGGWSSIGTVGVSYGRGYSIDQKRRWLEKIAI